MIDEVKKLTTEVVMLRADVLYLVRLLEKMETKLAKLEVTHTTPATPTDPFAGKIIEKL